MASVVIKLRDNKFDKDNVQNGLLFGKEDQGKLFKPSRPNEGLNDNAKLMINSTSVALLNQFGGKKLSDLKNESVLMLSPGSHLGDGDREDLSLFEYHKIGDDQFRLDTGNLMGVLRFRKQDGRGESAVQVQVLSRFDRGANNYFLNYILEKAFDVSFGLNGVSSDGNSVVDCLLDIVFVRQLAEAANAGLFRQYRERRNNDWNFKGSLDLPRHLRENVPMMHGIAYRKREIEHDVPLNQMILLAAKTIRKRHPDFFDSNEDARDAFRQLQAIVPEPVSARDVLRERTCREPVSHPYFQDVYEPLRQTAKMILEEEKWSIFTNGESEVSGIVFDGSWLWENYLWALLRESRIEGLIHGENAKKENPVYPFGNPAVLEWYPDFYIKDKAVLDAKYKDLDSEKVQSGDAHEVISYMHVLNAESGFLLYPSRQGESAKKGPYPINGKGGKFHVIGLEIPKYQDTDEYTSFCGMMKTNEDNFLKQIKDFC